MESLKYHPLCAAERRHPAIDAARWLAAASLRKGSIALAALAWKIVHAAPRRTAAAHARLEFHAEAGAAEGALYLDGQLVGWIEGVTRL